MTEFYPINKEAVFDPRTRKLVLGRHIAVTEEGMGIGDYTEIKDAFPINTGLKPKNISAESYKETPPDSSGI